MSNLSELDRWRQRQLEEFQHAQVIDRLDQQRLLDEYQRAQAMDRLDQQNSGLSQLGAILADTGTSIGLIESDLARLLAVTDDALPAIVDHLSLASERLSNIERMIASPRETEAWELFRSGSRALTSAANMSTQGTVELAADWLEEAVSDLTRAVDTYAHNPQFWFALGLAHARAKSHQDAAAAFSRCARYAVEKFAGLAAEAVLLAAGQFRMAELLGQAHATLLKFLPALETCPEIHLNLAAQHGEVHRLCRALELKPLLAATAKAESVEGIEAAAAEVCGYEDGPVSRLRSLENAIRALAKVANEFQLRITPPPDPVTLPEPGVAALLSAEVRIHAVANQAGSFVSGVRAGREHLRSLADETFAQHQRSVTEGASRIKAAQELASLESQQERAAITREMQSARKAAEEQWQRTRDAISGDLTRLQADFNQDQIRARADFQAGNTARRASRRASDSGRRMAAAENSLREIEEKLASHEAELQSVVSKTPRLKRILDAYGVFFGEDHRVRPDAISGLDDEATGTSAQTSFFDHAWQLYQWHLGQFKLQLSRVDPEVGKRSLALWQEKYSVNPALEPRQLRNYSVKVAVRAIETESPEMILALLNQSETEKLALISEIKAAHVKHKEISVLLERLRTAESEDIAAEERQFKDETAAARRRFKDDESEKLRRFDAEASLVRREFDSQEAQSKQRLEQAQRTRDEARQQGLARLTNEVHEISQQSQDAVINARAVYDRFAAEIARPLADLDSLIAKSLAPRVRITPGGGISR